MTIEHIIPTVTQLYSGPGNYPFDFLVHDEETLQVIYRDANGNPIVLEEGVDYTVTLSTVGGTIVTTTPVDSDGLLEITRVLPITQEIAFTNNMPLDLRLIEKAFDRFVMILQQFDLHISRSIQAIEWRGPWVEDEEYGILNIIQAPDNNWYVCVTPHTSAVFATELATGHWQMILASAELLDLGVQIADWYEIIETWHIQIEQWRTQINQDKLDAEQYAAEAEISATVAAGAAAGVNMPVIMPGDAGKALIVAEDESGFVLGSGAGVPIGTVLPWIGGYFIDGSNGAFTDVLGNTIALANGYLAANNPQFVVCDGTLLNDPESPIFNGAGRYLPNLTNNRFIMGSTAPGAIGGNNAMAHIHQIVQATFASAGHTLTIAQIPSHNHSGSAGSGGSHTHSYERLSPSGVMAAGSHVMYRNPASASTSEAGGHGHSISIGSTGGGGAHSHNITPPTVTSGAASNTENRPAFLSCLYIMRIK